MLLATLMDELGTVTPVVTAIVAIATFYLRAFVKSELSGLKSEIHEHLDTRYLSRDVMDVRLDNIERRLTEIERQNNHKKGI
jgi:hypothetical protein